jgi:hypothetical protein
MNAAEIINFHVANRISEKADVRPEGNYSALVSYPAPTAVKPNRRSRAIRVELGQAYVDDFNELSEDEQDAEGRRLADRTATALTAYDAMSDDPAYYVITP